MGRGLFLGFSHAPTEGVGPQRSPTLEVPFVYAYTLYHRITNFDVVTHVGEVRLSWGQPLLFQKIGVPELPNFGGSTVFMPIPFNAERPNSA